MIVVKNAQATCKARTLSGTEIIKVKLHELQNHLHLATMEVELAQLHDEQPVDCVKLLKILHAFKQSLDEIKEELLPSKNSQAQSGQ